MNIFDVSARLEIKFCTNISVVLIVRPQHMFSRVFGPLKIVFCREHMQVNFFEENQIKNP